MPAGIPWLLEKYQTYVALRERLMADAVGLRHNLAGLSARQPAGGGVTGEPCNKTQNLVKGGGRHAAG